MRRRQRASEAARLVAPILRAIDAGWRRLHWWIGAMAALYAVSGITVVRPEEVAVVLRWGRVTGLGAAAVHPPGPLFALPPPIDEVVRVQVRRVVELPVDALSAQGTMRTDALDPTRTGYALTGDQNIVHLDAIVRYQVGDPVAWLFEAPAADAILRAEVTAALVRTLGERPVDDVLSAGRDEVVRTATKRAQDGLDAAHAGLAIPSLELTKLDPPAAVGKDFDLVQSAYIAAETARKDAAAYRESEVPKAQAEANTRISSAKADAAASIAKAEGEASAFLALDTEYRANPFVVRERLYRDGLEQAVRQAARVRYLPPPVGSRYSGLRITVPPAGAPGDVSSVLDKGDE